MINTVRILEVTPGLKLPRLMRTFWRKLPNSFRDLRGISLTVQRSNCFFIQALYQRLMKDCFHNKERSWTTGKRAICSSWFGLCTGSLKKSKFIFTLSIITFKPFHWIRTPKKRNVLLLFLNFRREGLGNCHIPNIFFRL